MAETPFGKRRPLVPMFEALFESAHHVDDSVKEMRRQIIAADAFCQTLENAIADNRPNFAAIHEVDAAVLQLRNDISDAAIYCTNLERLTRELHIAPVTDEKINTPRLLSSQ